VVYALRPLKEDVLVLLTLALSTELMEPYF